MRAHCQSPYRLMVDGLTNVPFATGTGIQASITVALALGHLARIVLVEPAVAPGLPILLSSHV